mgnify:FL=1
MGTKVWARLAVGTVLGAILTAVWWHLAEPELPSLVHGGWVVAAMVAMGAAVGMQIGRSILLIPEMPAERWGALVLWTHGLNTVLALSGDAAEALWLSRSSTLKLSPLAGRLVLRVAGSAFGVGILVVFAATSPRLWLGVALPGIGLAWALRQRTDRVSRLTVQCGLGVLHTGIEALAVGCAARSVDVTVGPAVAMLGRAGVELGTWLPVPLGGTGVHHLALTGAGELLGSPTAAEAVMAHHIITLVVGMLALGIGAALATSASEAR